MDVIIREITFEEILPSWRLLWPNRVSAIEPTSAIDIQGNYDMNLMSARPFFWGAFDGHAPAPVGVLSGFKTSERHFRSRGIWVQEDCRKSGVGRKLLLQLQGQASAMGCEFLWTMPRIQAWPFYRKNGFEILKETHNFEFGPHYIAVKRIIL